MAQKVKAKVVLCKCPKTKGVFGMRLEERGGDWVRTWAFKIDEAQARREGFNNEATRGTMTPTPEYPGCPYCGLKPLIQCGCGKVFCWNGHGSKATCPWCGRTGKLGYAEEINVQGGGF
jgi:hypothetical protein